MRRDAPVLHHIPHWRRLAGRQRFFPKSSSMTFFATASSVDADSSRDEFADLAMGAQRVNPLVTLVRPPSVFVIVLLLFVSSCEDGTVVVNYPPARTPELIRVERGVVGEQRESVSPNKRGQYVALPAAFLFVRGRAPYPVKAEVSIDDEVLEESPDPARQDELERAGKAYFTVLEITNPDDEKKTFDWQFLVSVPPALRTVPGFVLAIKTISYDPNASGKNKVSDPLVLAFVGSCASVPPLPPLPEELWFHQEGEPDKEDPFNFASISPNPTESDPCGKKIVVITSVKNDSTDKNGDGITIDLTYYRFNVKEVTVRLRPAEETGAFNDLLLDNQWKLRVQFLSAPLLDPGRVKIKIGWKPQ